MILQEIFNSDELSRRVYKHNQNIYALSALTLVVGNFLSISGGTVTGQTNFFSLSATTFSGDTIYSGSTNLYDIFSTIGGGGGGPSTFIQNGLNTFTGGTSQYPTVNITSATLTNISTSGTNIAFQLSATTLSGGTIYSGNTELGNIINSLISGFTPTTSGSTATTLNSWTLSGSSYFADFDHYLGTNDYVISIYESLNNKDVIVDEINRLTVNKVRIFVSDNTLSLRVILLSKGNSGSSGAGDVVGPNLSTDNAIVLFNGTTGKLIKNSTTIIDGSGQLSSSSISATTYYSGVTTLQSILDTKIDENDNLIGGTF